MQTMTLETALRNFAQTLRTSLHNREDIHIATNDGTVVVLPQEEYNSMCETLNLLADKKALRALLDGHNIRESGGVPHGYTVEETFYDL